MHKTAVRGPGRLPTNVLCAYLTKQKDYLCNVTDYSSGNVKLANRIREHRENCKDDAYLE